MKRASLVAAFLAAAALAGLTGTALAGGHDGSSGNSGNAPGHAQSAPQQSQPATPQSQPAQQQSQPVQTDGDNSHGTKPSSTTRHDTYATAGSGHTKQYGNGKTAGQVVEQRGAPASTVLHGPGNSQPHKVVSCPGGHEVDVHAYKGSSTCSQSAPAVQHVEHVQKQVEHVQKQGEPVQKQVEHAPKQVEHVQKSEVKSVATEQRTHYEAHDKVYICHATGSATNPYVLIHVSKNALWAHTRHQDGRDVVLGDALASGAACPTAPAATAAAPTKSVESQSQTAPTCTQAQQVQVAVGVRHYTGPKGSGHYVIIHPSTHSAHYENKHPDEIVWETRTISVSVPCTQSQVQSPPLSQVESPVQSAVQSQQQQAPTQTPAATAAPSTGGVAGVHASIPAQRTAAPATHGVLGAQATLRPRAHSGGVLGTIRSTTLPFTGLPLWPVVLGALALIGAGLAVRHGQRGEA